MGLGLGSRVIMLRGRQLFYMGAWVPGAAEIEIIQYSG